jgi:DNA topoisomerase-1
MRTDSLNIAKEAREAARETILKQFGEKYLPKKPKLYTSKAKGAQEAHEAIRPTRLDFTPEIAAKYLAPDELKLYRLIYNRFLASQMADAILESQTILFGGEHGVFKATGRKLVFDGFYRVMGYDDRDKLLPELKEGEEVPLEKLTANQHFTEPPPRYTEASLIKTLEIIGKFLQWKCFHLLFFNRIKKLVQVRCRIPIGPFLHDGILKHGPKTLLNSVRCFTFSLSF